MIQIYDVKLRLSDGVVLLEVCEGDESILIEIKEKVVFNKKRLVFELQKTCINYIDVCTRGKWFKFFLRSI